MSFAAMKKNRAKSAASLTAEFGKLNQSAPRDDDGFWKPEVDKSGNGMAILRFLPAPEGEDVPFVRIWDHGFQAKGGWFIEKSLTTLGEKCPVSEYNSMLWNSGTESDKTFVRSKSKRRLSYYSNIYVVKDPANPENEGKVFLFKYGKRIFDKLNDVMNPEFDDEDPVNPFDFWEGANFRMKIRKVEGYRNYDKSEFDSTSALSEDDDELENIWKSQRSLKALVDRSAFKSYDELKAKLYRVLDLDGGGTANTVTADQLGAQEPAPVAMQRSAAPVQEDLSPPWDVDTEKEVVSGDPALSFFEKLAEEE
jgi:hypothetical protein|tara:strand:- start:899 stop:1825 length:927 start_codon:yes stop_codon:yes gene_type:complete